ncbi:MAG: class I SAM-dependent methyltransferase, partial [Phycisphaerae bacterium]
MKALRRWIDWRIEKLLPDPEQNFQRFELDEALLEQYPWRSDDRVLDVGCMDGYYARRLSGRVREVIGIDLDHRALCRIDRAAVTCVRADGQRLPFRTGSFDTILCHQTACLFDSPDRAASEFVRCCAPGGRIVISVSNLRSPFQRANAALDRLLARPLCGADRPANTWGAMQWMRAFERLELRLDRVYSCNLCWPIVHRLHGRWL